MVVALPILADIAFWFGAFIFCLLCALIAKALFGAAGGIIGKVPIVGARVAGQLGAVEQRINNYMSQAVATCDRQIGAGFHALARLVDWLGRELNSHANMISLLASLLIGRTPVEVARKLIAELRRLLHGTHATASHAVTRIVRIEKVVRAGIGNDVLPQIRSLDRELGQVVTGDLPAIRATEAKLGRELGSLSRWAHQHITALTGAALVAPVAVALARLGGTWIRCENWKGIGRSVCALPASLLAELFSDAIEAFIVADLCDFVTLAGAVAHEFQPLLIAFVDVEDVLIGCHGATKPAPLSLPPLDLPPAPAALALGV
jgi:hypothetical protein